MKICPACSREYGDEHSHCRDDGVALVHLETGSNDRVQNLIGQIVDGRYRIERIVGRGGMGTVYACRHVVVGKAFAMKVLRPGVERSEEILQRFIREAQAANAVQSRHICAMTDFGQLPSGAFYVVMDLLQGMSLTRALREKRLGRKEIKHVFVQVAETLDKTHRAGIIHRDLKPDNVVLVQDEGDPHFVKLVDFGIAKLLHSKASSLTETGVILGTPYYMSPEQARGDPIDHRSDIYAVGVMMYRAFTGKLPFVADTAMGVLTRHLMEEPELPSRIADIDRSLEQLILRCMEKKPIDRFQSMADLAEALRAVPDVITPRNHPTMDERSQALRAAHLPAPNHGADPDSIPTPTKVATPQAREALRSSQPPAMPTVREPSFPPPLYHTPLPPGTPPSPAHASSDAHSVPPVLMGGHPPTPPFLPMGDPREGEAATNRGVVSSRYSTMQPQRVGRTVVWIAVGISLTFVSGAAAFLLLSPTQAPHASEPQADETSAAPPAPTADEESESESEPSAVPRASAEASASAAPPASAARLPSPRPAGTAKTAAKPPPQPAPPPEPVAEPEPPIKRPPPEIRSPFED